MDWVLEESKHLDRRNTYLNSFQFILNGTFKVRLTITPKG